MEGEASGETPCCPSPLLIFLCLTPELHPLTVYPFIPFPSLEGAGLPCVCDLRQATPLFWIRAGGEPLF